MKNLLKSNTASQFIDANKIDDVMTSNGYHLHHVATTRCYVSRTSDSRCVETYKGRYGEGYAVYTPNWRSTNYSYIAYYVK